MTTWFSATAALPQLVALWDLSGTAAAWLTIAVQIGFVGGAVTSAALTLSDILPPRRMILLGAIGAAVANAILYVADGPRLAIPLRLATGFFLAGVYPPALKSMATWFRAGRGTGLGILVGALTLGSAAPHLINGLGGVDWRVVVVTTSALTMIGGIVAEVAGSEGPWPFPRARFDPRQARLAFSGRGVRLASLGYFGHMWELYAMWAWVPVMIRASLGQGNQPALAEVASFLVIGCGAIGCVVAGWVADLVGRTVVTSVAMAISGSCCLLIGFLFGGNPVWLLAVAAIWGATVVADSAQFSACVTELGNQQYLGTALTIQTSIGFLLTSISIELVPLFLKTAGWRYVFMILAPGPLLGVIAMLRLRSLPEAVKIAHGRR